MIDYQHQNLKYSKLNLYFGLINNLLLAILPFLLRRILIQQMGLEYASIKGLFTSIITVLSLAELGIGSVMAYAFYHPIVHGDIKKICALLKLYEKYYRYIAFLILGMGLCLMPFLPMLIHGSLPTGLNLYFVFALFLFSSFFSYVVYAYKKSLIFALRMNYINSIVNILVTCFRVIGQIYVILVFHNYYLFICIEIGSQILTQLLIQIWSKKNFPELYPYGEIAYEEEQKIRQMVKDVFTAKLGGVILSASDTIVISSFMGIMALTYYQNYMLIIAAMMNLVQVFMTSIHASIGHILITSNEYNNQRYFKVILLIFTYIAGLATTGFILCSQQFITLWLGGDMRLSMLIVVFFGIHIYSQVVNKVLNLYKDAMGNWRFDKYRALITSLTNLTLNILTVHWLGFYGVIGSTFVATILISIPWLFYEILSSPRFIQQFKAICLFSVKIIMINLMIVGIMIYGLSVLHMNFLIEVFSVILIYSIIFCLVYQRTQEFQYIIHLLKRKWTRKFEKMV